MCHPLINVQIISACYNYTHLFNFIKHSMDYDEGNNIGFRTYIKVIDGLYSNNFGQTVLEGQTDAPVYTLSKYV